MPEFPDIVVYIEALEKRIQGRTLERVSVASPFLVRTATPPLASVAGKKVLELRRLGKRICVGLEGDLWLVLHLMIAGRLHWKDGATGSKQPASKSPAARTLGSKTHLAAFEFSNGTLVLTEAGSQKRASLHLVEGEAGLHSLDPGGLEIFDPRQKPDREIEPNYATLDLERFAAALRSANHTLKRALTDRK